MTLFKHPGAIRFLRNSALGGVTGLAIALSLTGGRDLSQVLLFSLLGALTGGSMTSAQNEKPEPQKIQIGR